VTHRFQFVEDHREAFEVKRLLEAMELSASTYYKWRRTAPARLARAEADSALATEIRRIHSDSDHAYGSPRVTAELRSRGLLVNEKKVARVMSKFSIVGTHLRKKVRTTVPDPSATPVADLFNRDFKADLPGTKLMGDITYLPVGDGEFLYLATVLDCFSRRVIGWSIADHMRTDLVADALAMAASTRGGLDDAIFHSDHGAQYSSRQYADLCGKLGVTQSMGAVGTSADNAACESFHASLKREILKGARRWPGAAACRSQVFYWINRYNTWRRHRANGQLSPVEYERQHELQSGSLTLTA